MYLYFMVNRKENGCTNKNLYYDLNRNKKVQFNFVIVWLENSLDNFKEHNVLN